MDLTKIAKHGEQLSVKEAKRRLCILAQIPAGDNAGLDGELLVLCNLGMFRYVDADTLERTDIDPDLSLPIGWIPTDTKPVKPYAEPFRDDAAYQRGMAEIRHTNANVEHAELSALIDARVEAVLKAHGIILNVTP